MYYYLALKFEKYTQRITERRALFQAETEDEAAKQLACVLLRRLSPYTDDIKALAEMEHNQQLTGHDMSYISTDGNANIYCMHDRQLVEITGNRIRILDIRLLHRQILHYMRVLSFRDIYPHRKRFLKQSRKHEKSGSYKHRALAAQTYRLIAEGWFRTKYASAFLSNTFFDPKCEEAENNWKQKKIRHQWQYHQKQHGDTVPLDWLFPMSTEELDTDALLAELHQKKGTNL